MFWEASGQTWRGRLATHHGRTDVSFLFPVASSWRKVLGVSVLRTPESQDKEAGPSSDCPGPGFPWKGELGQGPKGPTSFSASALWPAPLRSSCPGPTQLGSQRVIGLTCAGLPVAIVHWSLYDSSLYGLPCGG